MIKATACVLSLTILLLIALPASADDCLDLLMPYEVQRTLEISEWNLTIESGTGGALHYSGAQHLDDPDDAMFEALRSEWRAFEPTLAFFEGPDRGVKETAEETIRAFGESGYIRYLANQSTVAARSLEPSPLDEYGAMIELFPEDQVQLFYLVREAVRLRDRKGLQGEKLEAAITQLIERAKLLFGEDAADLGLMELADVYERYFGTREWWTANAAWFDPGRTSEETGGIFTNEINRASSQYRNAHMARILGEAVRRGERVFAAVGRNHIPAQAAAIECLAREGDHRSPE